MDLMKFPRASFMYVMKKESTPKFYKVVGTAFVQFLENGGVRNCFVLKPLNPESEKEENTYATFEEILSEVDYKIVHRSEMLTVLGFQP